jgi:DNA-directed RNA polymerase subunit RPC12/RpoP
MDCPMCETTVTDVLVDDDRVCDACGHRWTPEEVLTAA